MDLVYNFPLFSILICLFSGVLCTMLTPQSAKRWTVFVQLLLCCFAAAVLGKTAGEGAFTYVLGEFPAPWGNELRAGVLEAVMALLFAFVLLCATLGGWEFLPVDVDKSKHNLYFALTNLASCALMALVWTNDLFSGYVFLEILTLSSCGLLAARGIGRTTLAAVRYMILNLLGSGLFLLGVVLLYALTGQLLMVPMRTAVEELYSQGGVVPLTFALTILTVGLGIKSGLFPFYFWMPDTYGSATPGAAAILSALVSKAYLFLLFKVYFRCVGPDIFMELPLRRLLLALGVLGMVFGSGSAIRSKSLNRMAAYSSAAQIGYIYMGLGVGGTLGFSAAMFQILSHAVTKALLFLTTARLARASGESLLFENLQGSGRRDRDAGLFFTAASFSMVGIPIFAGFAAKLFFAIAAVESGGVARLFVVMTALAVSSVLNAVYFIRSVIRIYTSGRGGADRRSDVIYAAEHHAAPEPPPEPVSALYYRLPALALTACNLFLGLFSWVAMDAIRLGLTMFG